MKPSRCTVVISVLLLLSTKPLKVGVALYLMFFERCADMIMIMLLDAGVQVQAHLFFERLSLLECRRRYRRSAAARERAAWRTAGRALHAAAAGLVLAAQDGDFERTVLGSGWEFCDRTWTV